MQTRIHQRCEWKPMNQNDPNFQNNAITDKKNCLHYFGPLIILAKHVWKHIDFAPPKKKIDKPNLLVSTWWLFLLTMKVLIVSILCLLIQLWMKNVMFQFKTFCDNAYRKCVMNWKRTGHCNTIILAWMSLPLFSNIFVTAILK